MSKWYEEAKEYLKARYLLEPEDMDLTEADEDFGIDPRAFIDEDMAGNGVDTVEDWNWGHPTKELAAFYEKYGK